MCATNIKEENIVWSDQDFRLPEFIKIYPPPQIVKVEEGYMDSEEEERTLSASQVLTLHVIKDFKTVQAFDGSDIKISLPINSTAKLEIISQKSIYENVAELAKDLPKYAASVERHPWLKIEENDVLELKSTAKSFRSRILVCQNVSRGSTCELPLDYKARFISLGECPVLNPTMNDIVTHCKLPIQVKYIDDELKVIHEGLNANLPFGMNVLGPIKLQSVGVNKVLLITTWGDDRVVPLPLDLDIRVVAALGALRNDHNYAKLCKIAHSKTKVEDLELMFIKEGEYKVLLVEHNREILKQKDDDDDDDRGAYSDVAPRVPSRSLKPIVRLQNALPENNLDYSKRPGKRRSLVDKTKSLHLPCESTKNPEEVFGENVVRHYDDSETIRSRSPVKKVFRDIKKKAVKAKMDILTNLRFSRKSDSDDYEEYDNELLPEASRHATHGRATKSHAIPYQDTGHSLTGHEWSDHATSSHGMTGLAHSINAITKPATGGHTMSDRSISGHIPDPNYKEVRPLAPNIKADRYNKVFVQNKMSRGPASDYKIGNPGDMQTWTIEEVTECLKYCRLDQYIGVFKTEMIDGSLLADLDEEALRSLGINDKLHLTKMMKIIQDGWLPKH